MSETKSKEVATAVDEYNYSTFTSSEARGKTRIFAEILHAGDEAPEFEMPTRPAKSYGSPTFEVRSTSCWSSAQ